MVHAKKIIIRSKKEDSAFLYNVFEAHEGLAAYQTLPFQKHDQHRDMELIFTEEREEEVRKVLVDLSDIIQVL